MPNLPGLSSGQDRSMPILTVRFGDSGSSGSAFGGKFTTVRECSQILLTSGVSASHAWVPCRIKNWGPGQYDRQMNEIALKRAGPFGSAVKLRGRAAASYTDQTTRTSVDLICGSFVEVGHDLGFDTGIGQIWDDRWYMGQLTMLSVLVYDPQAGKYYWDFGRQCIYGDQGLDDCIDSPIGQLHAPAPKTGVSDGNYKPKQYGQATKIARCWTVRDVIENMRIRFAAGNIGADIPVYTGHRFLPSFIDWAPGLGKSMAGADRPLRDFRLQNLSLLNAFQATIRKAGPYDMYMSPIGSSMRNQLRILDMGQTYPNFSLETPDFSNASLAKALSSTKIICEGMVNESVASYFDEYLKIGDPPVVECMCAVPDPDGRGHDARVLDILEYAFLLPNETAAGYLSSTYFGQFKAEVTALIGGGTSGGDLNAAIKQAFKRFPMIGKAAYRIKLGANPWAGTKHDGKMNGGRMRFMPQNATGYNQGPDTNPRDFFPMEICYEVFNDYKAQNPDMSDADFNAQYNPAHEWLLGTPYPNLELSPDSTVVLIDNSRQIGDSYYFVNHLDHDGNPVPTTIDDFRLKAIRLNVTLQADWPITGRGAGDPNGTADRVDQANPTTYCSGAVPGEYQELLRSQYAHPRGLAGDKIVGSGPPETIVPDQDFPRRDQQGNCLFSDVDSGLMNTHAQLAQRDVRRVEKSGRVRIAQLAGAIEPGQCVEIQSADGLEIKGVTKSVLLSGVGHSERNPNDHAPDAWVEIGPADWAVQMAIPSGGRKMVGIPGKVLSDTSASGQGEVPTSTPGTGTAPQIPPANSGGGATSGGSDGTVIGPRKAAGQYTGEGSSSDGPVIGPRKASGSSSYDGPVIGPRKSPGMRMLSKEDIASENRYAEQDMAAKYDKSARSKVPEATEAYKGDSVGARPLSGGRKVYHPPLKQFNTPEQQEEANKKSGRYVGGE